VGADYLATVRTFEFRKQTVDSSSLRNVISRKRFRSASKIQLLLTRTMLRWQFYSVSKLTSRASRVRESDCRVSGDTLCADTRKNILRLGAGCTKLVRERLFALCRPAQSARSRLSGILQKRNFGNSLKLRVPHVRLVVSSRWAGPCDAGKAPSQLC